MLRTIAAVSMTVALLPCQSDKQIKPRQFLFDNYTSVMRLDMKRFRSLEMWDSVLAGPMRLAVGQIEQDVGFPLDHLDTVTTVLQWDDEASDMRQVDVLEGHAPLTRAEDLHGRWSKDKINGHPVLRDGWVRDGLSLDWGDNVRVTGREPLIGPVLTGKPRIGLPSADVMSLTVGVKNLFGYVVFDLRSDSFRKVFLRDVMPDASWPEGDAPQFFCARCSATGDPDDPHVLLEMLVRHRVPVGGKASAGIVATQKQVEAGIQKLLAEPKLRMLRPFLKKIEREVDGTEAIWRVDLGRARNVVGNLSSMAVPWLFVARSQVQVEVVQEAANAEEAAPAKPQPKTPPKTPPKPVEQGGGGGR